jgi:hypothetical protein
MYYFWKKDMDTDYLGIASSGYGEKYARQNFQRFVYAVNQPYCRDGSQSAFTNTSVFDRPYFEALFGGSEFPDGSFMIDFEEEIIEFQKLYMEEVLPCISKGLCATIYTQVSDVEDEINGLVTYDRKLCKLQPEVMLPVAEALQEACK